MQTLLELLLPELVLNVYTIGDRTLVLLAVLGVVAAQGYQLLANGTAGSGRLVLVGLAFAALGVLHDALHLVTRRQAAVGVSALTRVDQTLNAPLYG